MTPPTAQVRFWGSIPAQYKADEIATSTVDAYGRIVALITTARRPAVVVVVAGTQVTEVELEEPAFGSPVIDALDEGFVIADARNPGVRPNARIVAADGSTRLTFNAGDAIEQLLTDRSGAIWTSYFDEGSIRAPRMGNAPSAGPGYVDVCPAGLIRWTGDGEPAWFSAFDPRLDSFWLDVYALNVGDRRVWAYPYTDFPLVEIDLGGIRSVRSTPVKGARGIAVAGPTVAFLGRYEDRLSNSGGCTVTFTRHTEGTVETLAAVPLLMPDGSPTVGRIYPMVCRGSRVWMQFGDPHDWYVLEI